MAKTLSKLLAPRADLAAPLLLPSQHPRDGGTDRFGRERIEVVGQLAGYFAKHRDVGTQHGRVGSQRLNDRHAKTFGEARHDQAVRFGDQRRLLMLVDITRKADVRRQVAQPACAAGVADHDQVGLRHLPEGADNGADVLARLRRDNDDKGRLSGVSGGSRKPRHVGGIEARARIDHPRRQVGKLRQQVPETALAVV